VPRTTGSIPSGSSTGLRSWSREQADASDAKIRRKGKNALDLLVSVNGVSRAVREAYDRSTSFMTMDGADLISVLR
jgi:hypothetical protein